MLLGCALAARIVCSPFGAHAAEPPGSPPAAFASTPALPAGSVTLRAALEAAWQRAVAARELEGQRLRAAADRSALGRYGAAPLTLELSHRNDRLQGHTGRRETEIGLALPLWLPGQRAARAGTADAAAAQALAAAQVARLHLAGELRELVWQLAALQAEAAQADNQAQALAQLADDVQRRVQAGDLARADGLAAQAEHAAAQALQTDVRQRLHAARARWALLTGLAVPPEPAEPPEPPEVATSVDQATPATVPTHPELLLARQTTALARQRLELLRHSRRDAPEFTVGLRQDVPGRAQAAQGSLVVGLRLPFGGEQRNRPLEVAAQAELDLAQTQEQRLHERLQSDIAAAHQAQQSAAAQLVAETARARLLRERAGLIDKSFRAGETPLPDQLRALAAAAQADSTVARQTAALGQARARLQQAYGLLP